MTGSVGERLIRTLRRVLLALVVAPFVMAVGVTAVDAYRRRGKKSRPVPRTAPRTVPVDDGEITVYTYGQDLYDAMLAAIDGARSQILFETYIWKGDEIGETFKRALTAALDRGVEVYVVYDAFANLVVSNRFKRFDRRMKVLRFPLYNAGWKFWDFRHYGRDHRKILTVDDTVAFVGGYNIGAEYATQWRDTHMSVTGSAVQDLRRAFADFWNLNRRNRLRPSDQPLLLEAPATWDSRIRIVRNVPRLMMFPIRALYLDVIERAQKNIWMTHAYFLPDQDFVDSVIRAAERGVDVRVVIPHRSNHIVTDWISQGYYSQLLQAGVRLFRYSRTMVHAKTSTVDGSWTTIGTANIDRLSLTGNYEINVEVVDDDLAQAMEEIFLEDQANSLELTVTEWEARDARRKFTEFVLAPLRPLL